jgi:ATP-dependent Clp protease ATP-binding subunit ClpA
MFESYHHDARAVMALAQEEANRHGDTAITTTHLLAAVALHDAGLAHDTLDRAGITLDLIRTVQGPAAAATGRKTSPFTLEARDALFAAATSASSFRHRAVGPEHLLLALVARPSEQITTILTSVDTTPAAVAAELWTQLAEFPSDTPSRPASDRRIAGLTQRARDIIASSEAVALELKHPYVAPAHLLCALLVHAPSVASDTLSEFGFTRERVRGALDAIGPSAFAALSAPPTPPATIAAPAPTGPDAAATAMPSTASAPPTAPSAPSPGPAPPPAAPPPVVAAPVGTPGSPTALFDRLTDRVRRLIMYAEKEAIHYGQDAIGSEHVLLALVHHGSSSLALTALTTLGVDAKKIEDEVNRITLVRATGTAQAPLPFTPQVKRMLEQSCEEARALGHPYIASEHILLALVHVQESTGTQILIQLGLKPELVRTTILDLLGATDLTQLSAPTPPSTSGAQAFFTWTADNGLPVHPDSLRALNRAGGEAQNLGDSYVASEHLLLGLLGRDDSLATLAPLTLDAESERPATCSVERLRREVLTRITIPTEAPAASAADARPISPPPAPNPPPGAASPRPDPGRTYDAIAAAVRSFTQAPPPPPDRINACAKCRTPMPISAEACPACGWTFTAVSTRVSLASDTEAKGAAAIGGAVAGGAIVAAIGSLAAASLAMTHAVAAIVIISIGTLYGAAISSRWYADLAQRFPLGEPLAVADAFFLSLVPPLVPPAYLVLLAAVIAIPGTVIAVLSTGTASFPTIDTALCTEAAIGVPIAGAIVYVYRRWF